MYFFFAADDIIKKSLILVTDEFGPLGPPVYDDTPMRLPGVDGGGQLSSCPRYDPTPLKENIPVSNPVIDGTDEHPVDGTEDDNATEPTHVYQDTPSQTVDGTEEVTQEYNVQAQLDKYQKEHDARVSAHAENLKMYYRKHPSKEKKLHAGAPLVAGEKLSFHHFGALVIS